MQNDKYISTFTFEVEPFTEDFTGHLSWSGLGNILLRSAQKHASARGFGFGATSPEGLSWVFSRLIVECPVRPAAGQRFHVSTWATEVRRQFTIRLFRIYDETGEAIGHAYSVWALIDLTTRRPVDLTCTPAGDLRDVLLPAPDFPIKGASRISVNNPTNVTERIVHFSDLDMNRHLNSIRSLEIALDQIPFTRFEKGQCVRRIEVGYANECFQGEKLSVRTEEAAPGKFHIEALRADGACAFKAILNVE